MPSTVPGGRAPFQVKTPPAGRVAAFLAREPRWAIIERVITDTMPGALAMRMAVEAGR